MNNHHPTILDITLIFIHKIPMDIIIYLYKFLVFDISFIEFNDEKNGQYQRAYYKKTFRSLSSSRINNEISYFSRIFKKNGKHRYYIVKEKRCLYCNGCDSYECHSPFCRGTYEKEINYNSFYVGKNLYKGLTLFLQESKN